MAAKEEELNSTTLMIKQHLLRSESEAVAQWFNDPTNSNVINESSWELIPLLSSYFTKENYESNSQVFKACVHSLNEIATRCSPVEVVLGVLEQMDFCMEDDYKFCTLMEPLETILNRIEENKDKAIGWSVSTIKSYVDSLPFPQSETTEEIDETDYNEAERIVKVYEVVLQFLAPFVEEESKNPSDSTLKLYLINLSITLLGRPFCYISHYNNEDTSTRSIVDRLLHNVAQLSKDVMRYLQIADNRTFSRSLKVNEEFVDAQNVMQLLENKENLTDLSLSAFYYHLMTAESAVNTIPQVYHPIYIFHSFMYLSNCLLSYTENSIISKGLDLVEIALSKIDGNSLDRYSLELPTHAKFLNSLTKVLIFCNSKPMRQQALKVLRSYIDLFDLQARFLVLHHLYQTQNHSGLIGYLTSIFKLSIIECLSTSPPAEHFIGSNMQTLLKSCCKLANGASTDLIEVSDQVIAALNLIRFLIIRDKDNVTGFWSFIGDLEEAYLKPLRQCLDLAHPHWRVKLKDLEEEKKMKGKASEPKDAVDSKITITVGGENLPALPISDKIDVCHRAINTLDIIEYILMRINECIAENPFHSTLKA